MAPDSEQKYTAYISSHSLNGDLLTLLTVDRKTKQRRIRQPAHRDGFRIIHVPDELSLLNECFRVGNQSVLVLDDINILLTQINDLLVLHLCEQ